jgi:uncharacterized protein (DUF1330 family)
MKTNHKLTLAAISGVVIGVAGATVIHAQQIKTAPAYLVAELSVTDTTTFQKYASGVPATIAPFNGHYLVRAGKTETLEGEAPKRIVVIAFDSLEKARGWFDSPAYNAIKPIRHSSAMSREYLVEGVAPQ